MKKDEIIRLITKPGSSANGGTGVRDFHLVTRQIGDDGVYRKVETSNYFVKSPASEDVLVISLCNNLDQ